MTSPVLSLIAADYSDVQAYSSRFSHEISFSPTAIPSERLFAGLDPEKFLALSVPKLRRYGFFLQLGEEIIGWHCARQQGSVIFSMEESGIRPEYQGNGYYRQLLDTVVSFARDEGYAAIVSTHAADNNRILIPKLRYGFFIKGFEINPMYGLDVKLIYYFNDAQRLAHKMRVGSRAHHEEED